MPAMKKEECDPEELRCGDCHIPYTIRKEITDEKIIAKALESISQMTNVPKDEIDYYIADVKCEQCGITRLKIISEV